MAFLLACTQSSPKPHLKLTNLNNFRALVSGTNFNLAKPFPKPHFCLLNGDLKIGRGSKTKLQLNLSVNGHSLSHYGLFYSHSWLLVPLEFALTLHIQAKAKNSKKNV